MHILKYSIFGFFLAVVLFSCGSQAKEQQLLAADFFLRYSYDNGDFKSEARFRDEQGTMLALPEAPRLNGENMREIEAGGAMYMFADKGSFSPLYHFAWRDLSGDTSSFSFKMSPITSFSFSEKKIQLNKPTTLAWDGEPLGSNETMVFLWEKNGKAVTMQTDAPTEKSEIELPVNQLKKLEPGNWTLYLVRKQRTDRKNHPSEVNLVFEFYTNTKSFEVY